MEEYVGKLVIGTEVNDKQQEKGLIEQKRELEKHEKEAQELLELKAKYETDVNAFEEEQKQIAKTREEYDKLNAKIKEIEAERSRISDLSESQMKQAYAENPELSTGYFELLKQRNALNKEIFQSSISNVQNIEEEKKLLEEVNQQLNENVQNQETIRDNKKNINAQLNMGQIVGSIKNVNKGLTQTIKKVGRWALAIFGIRGAYMAVRNAINVLSQDDAQLKADITYMKNVFAYALEPVVRRIVDLAKQLMAYIGYIIKAWFKYDIFANANKHLQSANKSANELRKTIAGFDEMNILNDNVSTGGGIADAIPKIPKAKGDTIIEWIAKNKIKVLGAIAGIVAGITASKLGLDGIKALGVGLAIYGLITAIESLIKFLKDPTFDNFIDTLKGIALAVTGVAIAVGAWPVAFAGAIAYVVLLLVQNLDKIIKKFEQFNNWLDRNVLGWLKKNFGALGEAIYAPFKNIILIFEGVFVTIIGGIKKFIEGVIKLFKGDLIGGINDMVSGLAQILLGPFIVFYNGVMQIFRDLKYAFNDYKRSVQGGGTGSFAGGGGGGGRAKGGIFYPTKLPKLAVGGIINQPGRGVPYHGATIGERGAEAVVPLTDSQQMALLGQTIGRYVTINATIPVYAYNREVDRQMRRIQAEDNFASNR